MKGPHPSPPTLAVALLSVCLPGGGIRESVLGDLAELHARMAADPSVGRARAARWYWAHAVRIGAGYTWRRLRREPIRAFAPAWRPERGGGDMVRDFARDVRFAARSFVRSPGFFAVALVTLALGVGANAAVFGVLEGTYLRPLPFGEPDRLVSIAQSAQDGSYSMAAHTAATWVDWRDSQTSFDQFAGYRYWTTTVEHGDVARRVLSIHSLGSIFDVLDAPAMLGRTFTSEEEGPGAENLVVLSYGFWQEEYGSENPVGQTLVVGGVPNTILGVMPASFSFPTPAAALWRTADVTADKLQDRNDQFVFTLARLAPGRTIEQAQDEMDRLQAGLRAEYPDENGNTRAEVMPLRDFIVGGVGALWATLMGAVAFLLLLTCLNLANLLMSRASVREGEIAVRRALGASRGRLTRQIAAESLALSFAGGVAGLGVGWVFLRGILAWLPGALPRIESVRIDATVMAFTLAVAALAGLASALLPTLQLSRASVADRIRRSVRGRSGDRVRQGMVVAEIALAVVLAIGSGLLVRDYAATSARDPGFDAQGRTTFYLELPDTYDDDARLTYYRDLERELGDLPGVRAVGLSSSLPMKRFTPGAWVGTPGLPVPMGDDNPTVMYVAVSPDYRRTMGIPLLRGRDLTHEDGRSGTPSLLLSQAAAERLFPGEDAIGKRFYLGPDGVVAPVSTVVGIVGDVRQQGMSRPAGPIAYAPQESVTFWRGFDLVIDSDRAADALAPDVQRLARSLEPGVTVLQPEPLESTVAAALAGQRNVMLLFGLLAGLALTLAVIGVFGVVAFVVSRRTREIGIRIAVGAARGEVLGLVLGQTLIPVLAGALAGVAAALGLSRFIAEGLTAGTAPTDPSTFVAVPVLLVAVAMLASWVPARRASRVDPVGVLSQE